MTSLLIALALVLIASLLPLAVDGLSLDGVVVIAILTLLLWPVVAVMRALIGWIYRAATRRHPL